MVYLLRIKPANCLCDETQIHTHAHSQLLWAKRKSIAKILHGWK